MECRWPLSPASSDCVSCHFSRWRIAISTESAQPDVKKYKKDIKKDIVSILNSIRVSYKTRKKDKNISQTESLGLLGRETKGAVLESRSRIDPLKIGLRFNGDWFANRLTPKVSMRLSLLLPCNAIIVTDKRLSKIYPGHRWRSATLLSINVRCTLHKPAITEEVRWVIPARVVVVVFSGGLISLFFNHRGLH
jgi:hypothetical protein